MNPRSICPVCGGQGDLWATVSDRHYGNPGAWTVAECEDCGARFLDPMPTPDELGAFYPDDYYSHHAHAPRAASLAQRLRARLLPIGTIEPAFERPGKMLDLGCGSGWMLEKYRDTGWNAVGVEFSESACEAGRARGLTMHHGSLHDAALPPASFEYIRSNHSFEHLTDPVDTLREIHRLLKPEGTLFLGVPNTSGLMSRLFRSEWFYVGAPVHTINYNHDNLVRLVERQGFELVGLRYNSNHGGTIGSLQSRVGATLRRDVNLSRGPVTWAPLILIGFWTSRLLDRLHLGDCIEITARKRAEQSANQGRE